MTQYNFAVNGSSRAGNLTADGIQTFTWNAEERLTATAGVTYTHDGDGWRVKKSNGTIHWRSLSGEILAETDLSGNNLREYVHFAGRRVARRDNSGTVYYFLQDHLGSTRVITNSSGSIVRDSDYYSHGTEKLVSGTVDDPHKFAGMYLDSESGLYYTWFRMYSPNLGRWLAPDPVAGEATNPGSLNRYTYVLNNPTNFIDPLGLYSWAPPVEPPDHPDYSPWFDPAGYTPPNPYGDPGGCNAPGGECGGQPGGGGGQSDPKEPGKSEAEDALKNSDCAKALGAKNPAEAIKALEGLKYKWADLGTIEGVSTPWGMGTESFTAADYYRGVIRLNQNIGADPSNVTPGRVYGLLGAGPANLNSGIERIWNLRSGSVTNGVFWAIAKLHELGHRLGGLPGDYNKPEVSQENTTTVIDKCFGSLKNK